MATHSSAARFFGDTISGAGGDDTIFGSFSNDLLSGETGNSAAGTGAPTLLATKII